MTAKALIFLIAALIAIGYAAARDSSHSRRKLGDKRTEKPVEHTKAAPKEGRVENLKHEAVDLVGVDKTAGSHKTKKAHPEAEGTLNRHKRGGYGGQGYGHNVQDHKGHEKIVVVVGEGHQGHQGHGEFNGHEGYNHGGHGGYGEHGGHGGGGHEGYNHGGHGGYGEHGGHSGGGHGYGRR